MPIDHQRRQFLVLTTTAAATAQLGGCARGSKQHQRINLQSRKTLAPDANSLELVRYATLAANGHNTQPWLFSLSDNNVRILPDMSRRTPVVDPDDHHLYASLGCAAENLSITAQEHGKSGEVAVESGDHFNVIIDTTASSRVASPLFKSITQRQVTRSQYDGSTAPVEVLERLQQAANSYGVEATSTAITSGVLQDGGYLWRIATIRNDG